MKRICRGVARVTAAGKTFEAIVDITRTPLLSLPTIPTPDGHGKVSNMQFYDCIEYSLSVNVSLLLLYTPVVLYRGQRKLEHTRHSAMGRRSVVWEIRVWVSERTRAKYNGLLSYVGRP